MNLGYARTSTVEQAAGLEAQERDLKAAGADRIFAEQTSSIGVRPQLDAALDYLRDGDVLTVTKLDRLARSVRNLCAIVERIEAKGASLRILAMNLDTATPTGRLMLNVIGSVAQFEREMMLERQREGIAKAKGEGRYKGRKPTARAQADDIRRLIGEGKTREAVAKQLGIGVASVYRVLASARFAGRKKRETLFPRDASERADPVAGLRR
jgi:DNA invertase Pin-like site-specific DNA recombinase